MKITKSNISKGIKKLSTLYSQFEDTIKKFGIEEVIQTWEEVFKEIDFDYSDANDDFIKAIYIATSKSKFPPTIYEILEEMRNLYKLRKSVENTIALKNIFELSKLFERTLIINDTKTMVNYKELEKRYTYNQIEEMIKEKIKQHNSFAYTLEECLEELIKE